MEIIETYWNVNSFRDCKDMPRTREIIETYWNVNLSTDLLIYRSIWK